MAVVQSNSSIMLALVLGVVLGLLSMTTASDTTTYPINWDIPPKMDLGTLHQGKVLKVGDVLHFQYNSAKDDVLEVTPQHFVECNNSAPIQKWTDGNSAITLSEVGPRYFISGFADHCDRHEQYLAVDVVEAEESKEVEDNIEAKVAEEIKELYAEAPSHSVEGHRTGAEGEEKRQEIEESELKATAAVHNSTNVAPKENHQKHEESETKAPAPAPAHSSSKAAIEENPHELESETKEQPPAHDSIKVTGEEHRQKHEESETKAAAPAHAYHAPTGAPTHSLGEPTHSANDSKKSVSANGKSNGNIQRATFQFTWCIIPLVWILIINPILF